MWGTATSAFQIEGAVHEDGRGPSIWDTFSRQPGNVAGGDTGEIAADHYHRSLEDVALMAQLGITAYRFSIAWPRILPAGTGEPNQAGIDFYRRLIEQLRQHDIQPLATLFHWDLPQALQDAGGWANRATAEAFGDYAAVIGAALADDDVAWGTINEPWCAAYQGYADGVHAPGLTDMRAAFRAAHHLNLAHGLSVWALREAGATNIGAVLNLAPAYAIEPGDAHASEAALLDTWRNDMWLDPTFDGVYGERVLRAAEPWGGLPVEPGDMELIAEPTDWLGINYYHDLQIPDTAPGPRTAMGWPVTPEGLYDILARAASRTNVPIYVTENGAAFEDPRDGSLDDTDRIEFIDAHLRQVHRAIEDGIDVRGYFVWSLLDNFEWSHGYGKRFGLVHIDYETQQRSPRSSFRWYRNVVNANGLTTD